MKYSKATDYALHTILFLAASRSETPTGVQQLAIWQNISPTYLSKILTKLSKADMIYSVSGANGGYKLRDNWDELTFFDVIEAIEGKNSIFDCCQGQRKGCLILETMEIAEQKMDIVLKSQKISSLAEKISMYK